MRLSRLPSGVWSFLFSLFLSFCGICLFPGRWRRRRKARLLPVPSENVIENSMKTLVNWWLSALISLGLRNSIGASPGSCFVAGRINPAQDRDLHKKKSAAWKKGQNWNGEKGIYSFPLIMLEFMLDAAPSLERDIALLIFYPAFRQISSKRKDGNAGFLQNLGEMWCGGSGQRQHRGLPENVSPACSCLLCLACSTNSRKSAGITLGSEILLLSVV